MKYSPPIPLSPDLTLIPLDQDLPGFYSFIGAWLYKAEKTYLIDPGPTASIPRLLSVLEEFNVNHLDAVLLTHIHLDHAGGIGELMSHVNFTDTPVVCHPSAIKHLADPARLWEGSMKTLGTTARAYGPIQPISDTIIVSCDHYAEKGVVSVETPGHAVHHVSYLIQDILFAGEAGGVYCGVGGTRFFLRPATPPRFFLETSIHSIEKLINLPHKRLCYGHFGMTVDTPNKLLLHRNQLLRWAEVIRRERKCDPGKDLVSRCLDRLFEKDEQLVEWDRLEPEVQDRERVFLSNSIRGFIGYFDERDAL